MESKVQKQIIDYFSSFEEFHNTSKSCLKTCQNCAIAINKYVRRCNNINEADITNTPLEDFVYLRSKLSASLHNLISEKIHEIRSQALVIEELFEKLCYKCNILKESCREIDLSKQTPLVKGTSLQPPLKQLLDFVDDTVTYGNHFCAQINASLNVLSLKGLNCESQVDNFKIAPKWQKRAEEILAYTSFCSENLI